MAGSISNRFHRAELPEIAFSGRSNVGKSSLVTHSPAEKHLPKPPIRRGVRVKSTSSGFAERMMLVDLPGYGYAKAPKAMSHAGRGW